MSQVFNGGHRERGWQVQAIERCQEGDDDNGDGEDEDDDMGDEKSVHGQGKTRERNM